MRTVLKTFGAALLIFTTFGIGRVNSQQLPQFSQYIFNGLHINPGYAGYKGEPYIQSTYRSQWVNFPG
ncbi:type IX secretion system membrane protein PorP/SprF, partial [Algoriphagus aestuarii]|nr:type IX secretion system membrane protein PorP/SprF [Algoriphagus aestuarii]